VRYREPERIRLDVVRFPSGPAGAQRAGEFVYRLYERGIAAGSEKIGALAEELGTSLAPLPPFPREQPPDVLKIPPEAIGAAFDPGSENFFSEPIEGEDGVYVLLLREKLPARDQPLEEVRERVGRDYRMWRRIRLFGEHAGEVRRELQRGRAEGRPLGELAATLGVELQPALSFTTDNPAEGMGERQLGALIGLQAGEFSEFILLKPDLQLLYVEGKVVPEISEFNPTYQQYLGEDGQGSGPALLRQLMGELIAREMGTN
jgi:hypothetical protein